MLALVLVVIFIYLFYILDTYSIDIPYFREYFTNLSPFPIDIVYTWAGEKTSNNIRNSNNNELKFSIRSVFRYMPWFRRVFIVVNTRDIVPSWFKPNYIEKIEMVSLTDIMEDKFLPNTNSNAIETCLHLIPGLSNHYIYFCDDYFIGKKINYTHFFTEDGRAIVSKRCNNISKTVPYFVSDLDFKLPPTREGFYPHIPIPLVKNGVSKFINKYREFINWVRSVKKRRTVGCSICDKYKLFCPCQQVHYPICIYLLQNGMATTKHYKYIFFDSYKIRKLPLILNNSPELFCINDKEGLDSNLRIENIKIMNKFLDKKYPTRLFFEKTI